MTWELVLLDEALDEVLRVPGIRGLQLVADDALAAAVARGGTFLWFVQSEIRGRSFRSLPAAVTFTP